MYIYFIKITSENKIEFQEIMANSQKDAISIAIQNSIFFYGKIEVVE